MPDPTILYIGCTPTCAHSVLEQSVPNVECRRSHLSRDAVAAAGQEGSKSFEDNTNL